MELSAVSRGTPRAIEDEEGELCEDAFQEIHDECAPDRNKEEGEIHAERKWFLNFFRFAKAKSIPRTMMKAVTYRRALFTFFIETSAITILRVCYVKRIHDYGYNN